MLACRRIWNLTRALPPELYPPAYTWFQKKKVLIHRARLVQCPDYFCPEGTVVRVGEGFIWVKAQDSVVEINEARFEEGKPLTMLSSNLSLAMFWGTEADVRRVNDAR